MNKTTKRKLTAEFFEKAFGEKLTPYVRKRIRDYGLVYSDITPEERDYWLRRCVDVLLDPKLVFSGRHRIGQWERGWKENLDELSSGQAVQAVKPHYFGKYPVVRLARRFVRPESDDFERNTLYVIQDWLFDKYLRKATKVCEFGCGTGHNLLRVREVNPTAEIWGLDWAKSSQGCVRGLARKTGDGRMFAHNFDFFDPDNRFRLGDGAVIYTVAALEQIGKDHGKFVRYLLRNRPKLCIHIEPIGELLDQDNLFDYLSVRYFEKRNYLAGFLDSLRRLEKERKVRILKAQRSQIGSLFIDGYSVIVWKPV